MNSFVLKNTFIKIYIYYFLINIFIKIIRQNYALKTVLLSKRLVLGSTEALGVGEKKTLHTRGLLLGELPSFQPHLFSRWFSCIKTTEKR
jgi:hypothetical protein